MSNRITNDTMFSLINFIFISQFHKCNYIITVIIVAERYNKYKMLLLQKL